jgi:adenosylcobinamide-phosphate synthase
MVTGFEYLIIGLIGAILIDIMLGDPHNRFHPVSWIGTLISILIPKIKAYGAINEKRRGVIFVIILVTSFGTATQLLVLVCVLQLE